jgi:hypothetical protein
MPAPPLPYPTLSPIRLEPTEGGTDEFPGAFGGCPCRAFNFATSAASASTSSINCSRLNSASASRPSEQQLIEIHPLLLPGRSCAGEQILSWPTPIHPPSGKENSANFALTEF